MGFDLVWADAHRQDLERDPPHYFRCNIAMMALICAELEAQGVGAYEDKGVRNHAIDLNKLASNDGVHVSWAECSSIVQAASEQVTLTTGDPELAVDPEHPSDPRPWADLSLNPDLTAQDKLDALQERWPQFLEWARAAVDHDGFYVF